MEKQTSRIWHQLDAITRTKGGHRLKAHELMYAVHTDGTTAGISGDVWRHNAYRSAQWTDEGICVSFREPGYDLPFAPEREEGQPIPNNPFASGDAADVYVAPAPPLVDFGTALAALKAGKRITRAVWGGYWRLSEYGSVLVGDKDAGAPNTVVPGKLVLAFCRDGRIEPAQPYQSDWLAEDWMVLD